jgi:D-alanine-D-alanine ligase
LTRDELLGKRIAVLMGGESSERDVSIASGKAVSKALRKKGYKVVEMDVGHDIAQRLFDESIEVAFIALHGRWGEDGCIQGLLECLRIPYTGSGVTASALGMDKVRSRLIFRQAGLPVPQYILLKGEEIESFRPGVESLTLPLVIKPSREGSSVGVEIVRAPERLGPALQGALSYSEEVLVEEYIPAREIHVGILDDTPLGAIEIRPKGEFYDYRTKYTEGLADHIFPAPLPGALYNEAMELAARAHRLLGCEGGTRVDMLWNEERGFFVLEVNTLPGMTSLSLLPEIARGVGISFEDLCERILLGARLKA